MKLKFSWAGTIALSEIKVFPVILFFRPSDYPACGRQSLRLLGAKRLQDFQSAIGKGPERLFQFAKRTGTFFTLEI